MGCQNLNCVVQGRHPYGGFIAPFNTPMFVWFGGYMCEQCQTVCFGMIMNTDRPPERPPPPPSPPSPPPEEKITVRVMMKQKNVVKDEFELAFKSKTSLFQVKREIEDTKGIPIDNQ